MKYLVVILLFFNICKSFGQVEDSIRKNLVKEILNSMPKNNLNKYVNDYLPEFTLTDIEGNIIDSEILKGKPTLINFWFTNCTPCIEEIPVLNEIKREYGNKVNFIAITFEKSEEIKAFLKLRAFDFQHLINSEKYLEQFGFFGYPTTILLDNEFKVVKIVKNILPNHNNRIEALAEFKNRISTHLNNLLRVSK